MIALILIVTVFASSCMLAAYASGTNSDSVTFIQYLDENTALEEVRNGNLDMYYYRVSPDRIEGAHSREGLKVFDSTGGSYSILINPAETEEFNPFFYKDVRFALNYLVDRKLIVNELMGGYGVPMISNYGPFDPEYLTILGVLEEFQFRYNPKLAEQMITETLQENGAQRINGLWMHEGDPVTITMFIRSDDPVRKSIGEILASELEIMGFKVIKDYGDLNKAFVIVYGSNPAEAKWSLYTEGWGGRSAFVRYDPVGLAQMYSPWFSNTPGFNNPAYWNYENQRLDNITQRIYTGDFESAEQRNELIQMATTEAISESVRIFLASKIDQYVVNKSVDGVINDFGAGVPTRFTPINARGQDDGLTIGVKQIYQGAWNPVRGLTDSYSSHVWNPVMDPGVFKHPFTGNTIPIRTQWHVETDGPNQKISVPDDAILWDPESQSWKNVMGAKAVSKVTFDLDFSRWHDGVQMDMYDMLYSTYFALEWGTPGDENDGTFDSEYTPQAAQMVSTLVGIRQTGESQIEVYVDYWHFDEAEIASWASIWSVMPWQVYAAMERAVLDGKASFSRSEAVSKNVNWLSLLVPSDAYSVRDILNGFSNDEFIPAALREFGLGDDYYQERYDSTIRWIEEKDHAVISNGPFYLDSYSPESRTITLATFDDPSYPFEQGRWAKFEMVEFPSITNVSIPKIVSKSDVIEFDIETKDASEIIYFVSNQDGIVESQRISAESGSSTIRISGENMQDNTNNIKIFAISNDVLRPDFYETSFIVSDDMVSVNDDIIARPVDSKEFDYWWMYIALATAAAVAAIYIKRRL